MIAVERIDLGAKFQVYPGEMQLFNKVFNRFDVSLLNEDEKELYYAMLDDVQTFVFSNT
jgi:hypothetical protein